VLREQIVVDKRGFRTDPYKRHSLYDLWRPTADSLIHDPRLEWLMNDGS